MTAEFMKTITSRKRGSPKSRRSSRSSPSSRPVPLILVVDDQQAVREMLRVCLESKAGCRVVMAETSEQALTLAQERELDAVFSDLNRSPGMDGFQFLKAFKLANPGIPLIVHSATLSPARARKAYRLGAFLCVPKPSALADLLIAVRKALAARRPYRTKLLKSGSRTRHQAR